MPTIVKPLTNVILTTVQFAFNKKSFINKKMKSFFLSIMTVFMVVTALAQPSFQISGQITGLNYGTASLNYIMNNQTKQLVSEIKNGKFKFTGSLADTQYLNISIKMENGNGELFFFA